MFLSTDDDDYNSRLEVKEWQIRKKGKKIEKVGRNSAKHMRMRMAQEDQESSPY